jgi:hypothetical protein
MQMKDLGEMVRTIKGAIEGYFGLAARLGKIHCHNPAYKPLCKSMGVGLFAAEIILDSPTGKPVAFFGLDWQFQTRVRDVDEDEIEPFGNTQDWPSSLSHPGPLLPDARVVSVSLGYWKHGWLSDYLSPSDAELWDHVKQALKARFPEVRFG